ncbi:MAG: hypothetical protein ACXQTE_01315 [Methanosarcinaceae archaeon]
MNRSNVIHVFDLDHTLVIPDTDIDLAKKYMTIDHHVPIKSMMRLFESIDEKVILTARHPCLQATIESMYGCPTMCRDYCLDWNDICQVNASDENLNRYLDQMVKWKTSELNRLAKVYDTVVFYDDMIERFDSTNLSKRVVLLLPMGVIVG